MTSENFKESQNLKSVTTASGDWYCLGRPEHNKVVNIHVVYEPGQMSNVNLAFAEKVELL